MLALRPLPTRLCVLPRVLQRLLQTIIVGAVNLLFTVLAIMTVDKYGRKPLLFISGCIFIISTLIMVSANNIIILICLQQDYVHQHLYI